MFRRVLLLCLVGLTAVGCALAGGTLVPTPAKVSPEAPSATLRPTETALVALTATATPTATSTPTPPPAPSNTPRPTETAAPPTATEPPSPTAAPSPTAPPELPTLQGSGISQDGVSFSFDPALGDGVYSRAPSESLQEIEFAFAVEGFCREVGCVTVYPAALYRSEIWVGSEIIDSLQAAIASQSNNYFPTIGAAILLRAQTHHLSFQNGSGIRAIVMRGQDSYLANNEAIVYDFHGLTADQQFYVVVQFPVDAAILLSTYDPAANTNENAFPVPEWPDDVDERFEIILAYNEEAQQQLENLAAADFAPNIELLDALVASLLVAPSIDGD